MTPREKHITAVTIVLVLVNLIIWLVPWSEDSGQEAEPTATEPGSEGPVPLISVGEIGGGRSSANWSPSAAPSAVTLEEDSWDNDAAYERVTWNATETFTFESVEDLQRYLLPLGCVVQHLGGDLDAFERTILSRWNDPPILGAFTRLQRWRAERLWWLVAQEVAEDETTKAIEDSIVVEGKAIATMLGYEVEWDEMVRLDGEGVNVYDLCVQDPQGESK